MSSPDFFYEQARANIERTLIKGRVSKADVFITRIDQHRCVVKDYAQKGFWERNLIGRIVIGREARAYMALSDIEGLPKRFQRLSPFSFAVEFLEGRDFGSVGGEEIGGDQIGQLERIVQSLHERGWVHLDLHRRANILLSGGRVYLIDFASAMHTGLIPILGRVFTALIGIADLLSIIKMKTIYCPDSMSSRERFWLHVRNAVMPSKW